MSESLQVNPEFPHSGNFRSLWLQLQTSTIKHPIYSVPIGKTCLPLRKCYSVYTDAIRVHSNVTVSIPNPIISFYRVYLAY